MRRAFHDGLGAPELNVRIKAAEHFAITADIYRVLGELPEHADLHDTADGGPKTIVASARRICRMLGRDLIDDEDTVRKVSSYFAYRQFDLLQRALMRVYGTLGAQCDSIIAAGAGAFVVERLARFNNLRCVNFSSLFDVARDHQVTVSTCAPAAALARLMLRDR